MRNTFRKLNISKALIMKGVSLVVVFATLVSAYAAFSMNATLGWFSKNNTVTANGMITQAYHSKFLVTYTPVDSVDMDDYGNVTDKHIDENDKPTTILKDTPMLNNLKVPGQTAYYDIVIKNIGLYTATLTGFGFDAPGATDDVPLYVDQKTYYLSTELSTGLVMSSNGAVVTQTDENGNRIPLSDRYLRDKESGVAGQINFFDWLPDNTAIVLNPGDSVTFTIKISFVDEKYEQNVFKNFAENGGTCRRRIFLAYDE